MNPAADPRPRRWRARALFLGVAAAVVAQLVPYGWAHSNPPVVANAPWPDPETEALGRAACYSCHSNETDWPFYSYVAPMSWLVRRDVEAGRDELNFSEWNRDSDADDAAEVVADGSMPPQRYTMLHPDARLSEAERRRLIAALETMERFGERDGDDVDDDDD